MNRFLSNFILPVFCLIIIFIISKKQDNHNISAKETSKPTVYLNIDEAKKIANESKKEILIIFETSWSESSDYFKKNMRDAGVREATKDYVICMIDYDKSREVAEFYKVTSIPSYVITDENGDIKKYGSGYKPKGIFINWLRTYRK